MSKPAKSKAKQPSIADTVDKHQLYQDSVQSPEADVELIADIYKKCRGKKPRHLREDFCGTAFTLSHWIQQGKSYSGEGYDIDDDPINWGKQHNFAPLGSKADRAKLHIADARQASEKNPDVRVAFNFSYWIFQERHALLDYFQGVLADLAENGVFIMDIHGGPESTSEDEYESDCGDFTYVWHQHEFSPVTHHARLALHYRFADGSRLDSAFTYAWRMYSIPEIVDILSEAGFASHKVFWQDPDDEEFRVTRHGVNQDSWVACIAALK